MVVGRLYAASLATRVRSAGTGFRRDVGADLTIDHYALALLGPVRRSLPLPSLGI
jgi:hypothetical protein